MTSFQKIRFGLRGARRGAFTLIELMVAVGLMAIMMSMIAQIFFQATTAFRSARASMEIHRTASAILSIMENDFAGTEFCTYGGRQGYFALSKQPDRDPADPEHIDTDAVTFTTLAAQPGARYAAPEAVQQLALVRYELQFDGGSATVPDGTVFPVVTTARPTYRLVKRVRFPRTGDSYLDMEDFNPANLVSEVDPKDSASANYAAPEPIGFGILYMKIRLYCRPETGSNLLNYYDSNDPSALPKSATGFPRWVQLGTDDYFGLIERPPAMVEITLQMTDQRGTKVFTFVERFYIPASERSWNP